MSSLSSSIYGAQTNKGVGGLLSGLDTDDLVKQMTAATRNKINRQYQSKQKLLYKQEAYREISKKLLSFSDKYFSFSSGSKTNILSPSFFEANTIKSSSSYVNVTGNAENIKNFSINEIRSVASAATLTSEKRVSGGEFSSDVLGQYISPLAGETFSINYNNETYKLSISKDFQGQSFTEVIEELNDQLATIKDGTSGLAFIIEDEQIVEGNKQAKIKLTGEAYISAASNDFLDVLKIGIGKDDGVLSTDYINEADLIKTADAILSSENSFITFDYNGVKKTIDLSGMNETDGKTYTYDADGLRNYLQDKLDSAYGVNVDGSKKITVNESGGKLSFTTNILEIDETTGETKIKETTNTLSINNISSDLSQLTGLKSGSSNRLNLNATLEEAGIKGLNPSVDGKYLITINNKELEFEKTATLNDVIKSINSNLDMKINISYSATTDTFSIRADETGSHIGIDISDPIEGSLAYALFGDGVEYKWNKENGTDTDISYMLNGKTVDITRSTANFSIDGINIELNKNAEGITTPITFDVTNNSDEVVERVKQFINDYNEIITLIGSQTKEKPNRNYLPLTPEQQDEMEEKEIENWNKEAKKGVLFGDSNMNSVMNNLRFSMTGLTSVSSLTLANIGIASASMDTSGKLVLDEKKFKEKLLENPDEIANLFTQSTTEENGKSGIAIEIQKTLRENIGAFGTSGILIEEAGLESGLKSDQNNISLKMKEYDDKMKELKKDLEKERERYWSKFSALESALNNLNAQSSWLTDMMG